MDVKKTEQGLRQVNGNGHLGGGDLVARQAGHAWSWTVVRA